VRDDGAALVIERSVTSAGSSVAAALAAPSAAASAIKESGLSFAALRSKVRAARGAVKLGRVTTSSLSIDDEALRWRRESRPVSDELAREHGVDRVEGELALRELVALGFEGWGRLRAFRWDGYVDLPLDFDEAEGRAVKHLLLARAARLPG
jgi:hypothetical protein